MQRQIIKDKAIDMVKAAGLVNLSRVELCAEGGIAEGSFSHVMGCLFSDFIEELRTDGHVGATVKVKRKRVQPADRKADIVFAGLQLAETFGYDHISRIDVAEQAGISQSLVNTYFGTMVQLKRQVMRRAIDTSNLTVIAQGIANKDPHALKAPLELRRRAIASLGA